VGEQSPRHLGDGSLLESGGTLGYGFRRHKATMSLKCAMERANLAGGKLADAQPCELGEAGPVVATNPVRSVQFAPEGW
jgi:hypothetical protein